MPTRKNRKEVEEDSEGDQTGQAEIQQVVQWYLSLEAQAGVQASGQRNNVEAITLDITFTRDQTV